MACAVLQMRAGYLHINLFQDYDEWGNARRIVGPTGIMTELAYDDLGVETPLFVDSSLTSMIQTVDLCFYSLRRTLEKDESDIWDIFEPCGDVYRGNRVGVRHFTGPRPRSCRVCIAHGRR